MKNAAKSAYTNNPAITQPIHPPIQKSINPPPAPLPPLHAADSSPDRSTAFPSPSPVTRHSPAAPKSDEGGSHYSLRRGLGFWDLTFAGHRAIFKHEQGADYVAWLLDHPNEQIHGLALALKIRAMRNGSPADSADVIQERALALDDAEASRRIFLKQRELEEIVDDERQSDQMKAYAYRDLEAIYAFQKKNLSRTRSVAQKASDSVGKAIKRFHQRLANAVNADGTPSQVLRSFATYIKQHILTPSGRGIRHGGFRPPQGCGGFFKCD